MCACAAVADTRTGVRLISHFIVLPFSPDALRREDRCIHVLLLIRRISLLASLVGGPHPPLHSFLSLLYIHSDTKSRQHTRR